MDDSECKIVLRIYPGFSEVRRDIEADNQFQLTLSEEQYQQIIPSSIEIESDHTTLQTITKKSTNLEGKTVYVRNSEGKNISPRKATLVRGRDWLVKDHQTGRFYRASWSHLEFEQPPATDVYDVEFNFSQPVKATLSFLINTISWKPRYQLRVNDEGQSTVKCVAILRNDSPMKYFVEKAELFGGQVALPQPVRSFGFAKRKACYAQSSPDGGGVGPLSDFTAKDISGVHQYDLLKPFCLNADSSVYIEFLRPSVTVEQFSSIELSNPGDFSQAMDRVYMLCSDQFLPAGNLSIRQSGRIVGFHELSDLPAKEKREISLGKDSSSVVERKETVIKKSDSSSKIKVHISLINNHGKIWRLRYRENCCYGDSDTSYTLENCEGARQTSNGCEITREVPAEQRSEAVFVISRKIHRKHC